jgi:hypothetical protein
MHRTSLGHRLLIGCLFCLLVTSSSYGQSSKGNAAGSNSPSATSLPGLTFSHESWNSQISAPPGTKHDRILCYSLVMMKSTNLPYTLQPTSTITYSTGKEVNCSPVDDNHPLLMDTLLVIAIDARRADTSAIKLFNINVTTASNSPISSNPVRPSFGAGASSSNLGEAIYFLAWPVLLQGDTTATVSINAVYTPPVAGQPWKSLTLYPPGSIVVRSSIPDGHYYITYEGGLTGSAEPTTWATIQPVADGTCQWVSIGTTAPPQTSAPKSYVRSTSYNELDVIYVPITGQYYAQTHPKDCTSGASVPVFASKTPTTDEELPRTDGKTTDGDLQWLDQGTYNAACGKTGSSEWRKDAHYKVGEKICNPAEKGREYAVLVSPDETSKSGDKLPAFIHLNEQVYNFKAASWADLGRIAPTTISTAPAQDQTLPILNQPLPQTHSLYYYNVSSGVFVTTIRTRSFGFAAGSSSTTNSGTPIQTGSSLIVDPVISLTRYLKPFDAERHWQPADLFPGITLSFSLSAPTSNFYVGGSSEFQRYLQLNYGFAIAKTPKLTPQAFVPSSATSPPTVQVFSKGAYLGLTFNISGLIQGLSSGGGSSKGSAGSSSSSSSTGSSQ